MSYNRAAVFVVNNDKILLLYRKKDNKGGYVVPGGTVEKGETPKQAAIREVKEEANIEIYIDKLLWEYGDDISNCYYYISSNFEGEVKLGGEEAIKNSPENQYRLDWINISELNKIVLYPSEIHKRIKNYFKKSLKK